MDLFAKSVKTLELPEILEMLASEAVSDAAKTAARAVAPSGDRAAVTMLLAETTDAKNMMALRGNPPFSGVKDIRSIIKRADLGGTLNTRELMDVAALLRAAAAMEAYFASAGNIGATALDHLFSALYTNKHLQSRINDVIVAEDEISDSASTELSDIRRHMRVSGEKVRQILNRIITSAQYAKALQEPIITVKNDRYVVPVKAEYKSSVPGLVHDISSSGATFFIEPMAVVQVNNDLHELAAREKREIERILADLSVQAAGCGDSICTDFEVLIKLDLIFAKAKLSYRLKAVLPEISHDRRIILKDARHPLLPKDEAVPIDVRLGVEFDTLVITGPNTGGKTVSLKTLGLLCAMAQSGLHIPASDGSVLPVLCSIFADIGDEQSIEQSLSTFSSHMKNIVGILECCEADSLLLFDEIGAGTDPVEGAALAIAIIENVRARGAIVAATTHYAELKTYAVNSLGVMNASCEFDVETLKPTYRLITGVPGKSNAFAISKRLGLPEEIIDDAKNRVDRENAVFEDAIANLETMRTALEDEQQATMHLRREAEDKHRQAEIMRSALESQREKATASARREAEQILEETRKTAESVMDELREIRRLAARDAGNQRLNDAKAGLFRRLNEAESAIHASDAAPEEQEQLRHVFVPGDRVKLYRLGTFADVISVSSEGILTLQAGIMKITAGIDEVSLAQSDAQRELKRQIAGSDAKLRELSAQTEVDVRGMAIDEAIPIVERFLDNARTSHLSSVTVIHGKGTGALRAAVHKHLRQEKGLKSFRLGRYGEGEDGVTVVEL